MKFLSTLHKIFNYPDSLLIKNRKRFYRIGILFILVTNLFWYYYTGTHRYFTNQKREATTGLAYDNAKHFFYFFYYTGYFPLASLNDSLEYSVPGAYYEITHNGKDLIMEYKHWSRLGENLRIITFYPDAIIKGSARSPSVKLFNAIVFVVALIIFFTGFYLNNRGVLGLISVTIVMFTPYFIYEVYANENIFALLGATFMITAGMLSPYLFANTGQKIGYTLLVSLLSGFIIGFMSEIRGEIMVVALSALIIVFASKDTIFRKIFFLLFFILTLITTKSLIRSYFDKKFEDTYKLVVKYGGHPYTGPRIEQHRFWHPVFCGLGDFDTQYGYEWNDRVAYRYAIPILNKKYGMHLKYSGKLHLDQYYDEDSLYYVKFDEIDQYEEVVRDKVISDILNDPVWYLKILFRRMLRILHVTAPFYWLGVPFILLLIILWRFKQCDLLVLLLSSLPLSLTPFLIYSGGNATLNSFFPELTLAIILCTSLKFVMLNKSKWRKYS